MLQKPGSITLPIPIKIVEYKHFIDECCAFINDIDSFCNDYSKSAKFKLVIMELLTNAVKHSKTVSYLEIIKTDDQLIIKKIDGGNKFAFKDIFSNEIIQFPMPHFTHGKKITALLGNNYKLPLVVKSGNKVEFLEPFEVDYSEMNIPENFGLLIIKQCSDYFYYYFDENKKQNVFEVIFNL
ncbi:MAG: hypothetical protein IE931_06690 [Sphingobacteriales bacterium]|nr:hypothetical protein [Sphingobacteriales bacterium]